MIFVVVCLLVAVAVKAQDEYSPYRGYPPYYYDETPKPYAFNYNAPLEFGGQSSRAEAADGSGRVQGSYTVTNDEGHTRVVDYVADQDGFRASIQTNEPGTDNQNPADVTIQSAGPHSYSVYQRPYQYAPRYGRPALTATGQPIAPVAAVAPVIAPAALVAPVENALTPGSPALYNAPSLYNRNLYRNRARNPYLRY